MSWISFLPTMRTVRSNPVFHVSRYSWGALGGGQINSAPWRGRGYSDINSYGAYYDASANTVHSDGTPVGTYVIRDRAATSSDCG
ncbi:hypothetical protein [Streptomyces sp. NPDC101776]|uniref:hypothetical protein n=1 Tax=Streptomyces sp. NPDC101776 TaxID=3366146 RepID=UPI0038033C9C